MSVHESKCICTYICECTLLEYEYSSLCVSLSRSVIGALICQYSK